MAELPDSYRRAMRGLASTVCVIAAQTPQGPRGMTATAVMSLSADPPTLGLAVNRTASLNAALTEGRALCLQLLSEDQGEVARAFAGGLPPEARFGVGWWGADSFGSPRLEDAVAYLSGVIEQRLELATHSLLIVRIRAAAARETARPLLYAKGAFTGLAADHPDCAA